MTKKWSDVRDSLSFDGRTPKKCSNPFCKVWNWGSRESPDRCTICGGRLVPPEGPPPSGQAA